MQTDQQLKLLSPAASSPAPELFHPPALPAALPQPQLAHSAFLSVFTQLLALLTRSFFYFLFPTVITDLV